uniref:Uncharacterized protein n=1 Tax=Arundo donax TaxID=35708 RepID=A0A0A9HAY6_ARUDO
MGGPSLVAHGRWGAAVQRAAPSLVVYLEEKRKEAGRSSGGARREGAMAAAAVACSRPAWRRAPPRCVAAKSAVPPLPYSAPPP